MSSLVGLGLFPAEGDPGGLLAQDPRFGTRPPQFSRWAHPFNTGYSFRAQRPEIPATVYPFALALWLEETLAPALVAPGWDHLRRCFYAWPGREGQPTPQAELIEAIRRGPGTNPPRAFVEWVAEVSIDVGLGFRVLQLVRDARGCLVEG